MDVIRDVLKSRVGTSFLSRVLRGTGPVPLTVTFSSFFLSCQKGKDLQSEGRKEEWILNSQDSPVLKMFLFHLSSFSCL